MATSLDALEALLQFSRRSLSPVRSNSIHPEIPVPNPLNPTQPHLIDDEAQTPSYLPVFGSGTCSAFAPTSAAAPVVGTVPNPLATPIVEKHPLQHSTLQAKVSCIKAMAPMSSQVKAVTHGFAVNSATAPSSVDDDAAPPGADLIADKIRDALNSKSQRGKKRRNLNDEERVELTRTRNREHAKSTRMKKRARLEELLDIEQKYMAVKERDALDLLRRHTLVDFVENAGNRSQNNAKDCLLSSRLVQLACHEIQEPQFSAMDTWTSTSEDSCTVKVSARGADLESGKPKTLFGVICAVFTQQTSVISDVSLYWASPKSTPSSVGMFPSVSVLSFEPDCTSP